MEHNILIPRNIIELKGNLSYSESLGTWNTIRFTSELVKEFPKLKEKRSILKYKAVYYKDLKEFMKIVKNLKGNGDMPMLLWLYKDDKKE